MHKRQKHIANPFREFCMISSRISSHNSNAQDDVYFEGGADGHLQNGMSNDACYETNGRVNVVVVVIVVVVSITEKGCSLPPNSIREENQQFSIH